MAANIIDGKALALAIKEEIKAEVERLKVRGIKPGLAVILVGKDKASEKYVSFKEKTSKEVGIESFVFRLPEDTTGSYIISLIEELNKDCRVSGILVQLPLPSSFSQSVILEKINPFKDVDGFTPYCLGRLFMDSPLFIPCTPKGIIRMLDAYNIDVEGKKAVVIGRSIIVGKPLSVLLLRRNATVTICHSRTKDLEKITKDADILCVAIGKPGFIKHDMVKDGATVIDVGINVLDNGKVVGDVDFNSVRQKASFITPVPGGVGPMTIAMLMENTVMAAKLQSKLKE